MSPLALAISELAIAGLMMAVILIHAHRFEQVKPITPLFHAVWTAVFMAYTAAIAWAAHSWWLAACSVTMRTGLYSLLLNLVRGKDPWYIHASGALWDRYMTRPLFMALTCAGVIGLVLLNVKMF